jgi:hypothetical protein
MAGTRLLIAITLVLVLCSLARASHAPKRFEDGLWYDNTFNNLIRDNCSTEYSSYIHHYDTRWWTGWPTHEEPLKTKENIGNTTYIRS